MSLLVNCCRFYLRPLLLVLLAMSLFPAAANADGNPFAEFIRKSEPLTPDQEQKTFHLPPGFEMQLVASEPQIGKPMNMAFDARGRLWLTQSREYPFAAPTNRPARDKIMVLENFDSHGRARKVSTFAEGLNVPIGLYPYKNGCIAFSIPNIYFFEDTNGDGKADKRTKVLGKFGFNKDLHGLTSSFRRGFDGWLYAEHGFKNDSTLTASDGSQIQLNSGNTYRFKPDGTRVEHNSFGQVNPFGLMFDPLGDLWGSDCHSLPVYLLLRGAYYPSFGKPNDGIGFAPSICDHSHGSTAIAGMVFYAATNFPPEFRNNTYIGNVMTCRINRDSLVEKGSTRIAREEPDFVVCDDAWFRPVDIQLGPDGALYVADFYNRIIGHYEVPLDHPGRDRERGRVWRIVYTGTNRSEASTTKMALPSDIAGLVNELGHSNINRRMLAMSELTDTIGTKAIAPLKAVLENKKANSFQRVHALWTLHRLGALDERTLLKYAADSNGDVRVHVMRIVAEIPSPTASEISLVRAALRDRDAYVRRAAADALGRHPAFKNISALLNLRESVPADDLELLYVARIALRDNLAFSNNFVCITSSALSERDSRAVADVAVGIQTADAARFLIKHIQKFSEERSVLEGYLRHITRFAPEPQLEELARFTRQRFAADLDFQVALFKSTQEGLSQRGAGLDGALADWGASLVQSLIAEVDPDSFDWRNIPAKNGAASNPWFVEKRESADGDTDSEFLSSCGMGGENLTGTLRSRPFTIPAALSFYIAGYDGSPDRPMGKRNYFRLRSADGRRVLAEAPPPAKDIAQAKHWELTKVAGQKGFLEIVDGNGGHTAAWLSVGRLQPAVVPMPACIPSGVERRHLAAAELAESLHLPGLDRQFTALLMNAKNDAETRAAAARAVAAASPQTAVPDLARVFSDTTEIPALREVCARLLAKINSDSSRSVLISGLKSAASGLARQIAVGLAATPQGAQDLLRAVEEGKVSAHVLQENSVREMLLSSKLQGAPERLEKLTSNLVPLSVERQHLIDARRSSFASAHASPQQGAKIFTTTCAVCHSINSQGGNIGPQLDGVANRGPDRLIEDILDPNRNVDPAFYYSNVTLKDDTVVTGLFRREEGAVLVFASTSGKEVSVPKSEIAERRQSKNSLMPDNFGEMIPEKDFYDLLSFLLSNQNLQSSRY